MRMRTTFPVFGLLLALLSIASAFQFPPSPRIIKLGVEKRHRRNVTSPRFRFDSSDTLRGATSTFLQAAPAVLPSISKVALSCLLPASLGYIKSEYGVSYGYGTSVACVAFLVLQQLTPGTVPYCLALALLFYGTRLNLFLLYREVFIPKFRKFREEIETKAPTNRLSRTPFILSCALLYACLGAPLFVTSSYTGSFSKLTVGLVACTWIGFVLAAFGDLQKSVDKARDGDDTLVTGGLFHFLRHPNFTGETLGWTASFLAAVSVGNWRNNVGLLGASAMGWAGIVFVLAMASTNLEKKQKEKYGDLPEYQEWVNRSWAGLTLQTGNGE